MTGEDRTGSGDDRASERFAADWLALRGPADLRARDAELMREAMAAIADRAAPRIVDLGAGAGGTLAAIGAAMPADADVLLVDRDPELLAQAVASHPGARTLEADLFADVETVVEDADLVTTSAFLDLCSPNFLERLADALPPGAVVYAALTYDGREEREPALEGDAAVVRAFLRHQRRDKGMGPSLGPTAAIHFAAMLAGRGYAIRTAKSPWRLTSSEDAALMAALDSGIADAAAEEGADVYAWRAASPREASVTGHIDLLALPQRG